MPYHLNPNMRCPICTYFGGDIRHLKACVPRRYWPVGEVSITPPSTVMVQDELQCECGYVAKHKGALALHRINARVHKVVPLPGGEFLPEVS